ncbi:MAG: BACON domain-containing carbohydrate-binding protein, partial [Ignavibacteria bacterium]
MKTKNLIKQFLILTALFFAFENSIFSVSFDCNGGSTTTTISVLHEWGVLSKPSWISVSPSWGFSGSQTITITCSPNTSTSSRSGTIVIGRASQSDITISVTQEGVPETYYTVTASAGSGGSISPSSQSVVSGGTVTFTAYPNTGYYTSGCSGGTLSGNTVTVSNVTSNRSVSVSFSKYSYTVTASAGSGGSVSPTSQTVQYGGTAAITVSPNTGYYVSGYSAGYLENNTIYIYPITSNRSISVSFALKTYTVTASAGSHGSISPSSRSVSHGGTTTFTADPDPGYYTSGCSGGSLSGNTVTVSNVTSNRSVSVSFSAIRCTISGHAKTADNVGIPEVTIGLSDNDGPLSTTTDENGYYSISVPYQWTGNVHASKTGYAISPSMIFISYLGADTTVNFTGNPVPPSVPTGVTATANSSSSITVTWTDGNTNETRYYIHRATSSSGTYSQLGYVGANVTTYTDTDLSSGTRYYYKISAYNVTGSSPYSDYASAITIPATPSLLGRSITPA